MQLRDTEATPGLSARTVRFVSIVGLVITVGAIAYLFKRTLETSPIDLAVFQAAGQAFVDGTPLYNNEFERPHGLRFIYAPFAAMLFAPMAALPLSALELLWTAANIGLVWWILTALLRRAGVARNVRFIATAILGLALLLEPIRTSFFFGQINVTLMALVVADCAGVIPRRYRGIATGIAAAIKVTPAAFGLVFLLRRDYRSLFQAIATGIGTIIVGFLVAPQASVFYWTEEFFRTDRAGGHDYRPNQALTGVLARLGLDDGLEDILWVFGALAIIAAATWAAYRFTRAGDHYVAFGLVALASLGAAPFAVSHHWVYVLMLVPMLVAPRYAKWRLLTGAATLVYLVGPYKLVAADTGPNLATFTVQNGHFWAAMALLVGAVVAARRLPRQAAATETGRNPAEPAMVH
ncbi:glycosyltransferase 87 family protein [Hoyosella subflava]|uniref:Putative glycosyltransferase n=1 Tax=Hoyosella subflava (strain DSM 45089 / JCM 17490 / NBRC 109087 / DQS3-9A1) TaxID=443218 RepID=F6EKH0_HOYSD|nr:glycosyltransferase 87 family protein [Hoyosella subflava]AEF39141.1 Putative glycosyltransferase [Hoyosella subflava DQS3-9A1]